MADFLTETVGSFLHQVIWMIGAGASPALLTLAVRGREHLPRRGPFILAANHRSLIDFIPIELACRRRFLYLVHRVWYDPWPLRWLFRALGCARVEGGSADAHLFDQVLQALARGRPVCMFPEGERSWTSKLGPGSPGAAYLALRSGAPLIPLAISGTEKILPRGSRRLWYGHVSLRFGEPVPVPPMTDSEPTRNLLRLMTADLMEAIEQLLSVEPAAP